MYLYGTHILEQYWKHSKFKNKQEAKGSQELQYRTRSVSGVWGVGGAQSQRQSLRRGQVNGQFILHTSVLCGFLQQHAYSILIFLKSYKIKSCDPDYTVKQNILK